MATSNSYPPHHHHSTERISQSHALSLLSSYLAAAATEAYLHPNALLTESGPITPSSGAHSVGLVLHNLKRVEAGLKGEQLGADLTFQKYGGEGLPDLLVTSEGLPRLPSEGLDGALNASVGSLGGGGGVSGDRVEWQDKTEFDREQEVTQGEIGERDNVMGDVGEGYRVPDVEVTKSTADREERKRRKKARRSQQRKADEAKRREKATVGWSI